MKSASMKNPAVVPLLLLCLAVGILILLCNVWPGLPSSTMDDNGSESIKVHNDSTVPAGTSAMR